jgi:hypothetical protein
MTQQEIIDMAFKVGIKYRGFGDEFYSPQSDGVEILQMEAFAKLVAAKEREACAQILANTDLSGLRDHPLQNWVAGMLFEFIKAIRARGKP